ncbi:hypothetical protein M9Y10_043032 [Tritrichomonas musculus]|uniref:Surface antigen BspA-like n=1 Tax=Tritrichomonas musculus TaxID=1915356 RepID=A0ABR2JYJ8_9EUKA
MESYIEDKKNLYTSILNFLEESDEPNDDEIRKESFQKLTNVFKNQEIEGDCEEMRQFLEIVKCIGEHHHRDQNFNRRVNELLEHYQDQIKQTLSNLDIFHIFENNKKIVLFLIQKCIITMSDEIYKEIVYKLENNGKRYCHFFIPELENFVGEEKMKYVKNELLKKDPDFFTNYEEKRQKGENDLYVCSLIREDSVVEFITYLNRQNISPSSEISPSIFETNPYLIDNKHTTLIEYSAFFGSIQIFQFLLMSKVELTPSLWLYAIHSKNAELIHLLESNEVPPPKYKSDRNDNEEDEDSNKNYSQCLIESIKCHHNDIADYIDNNFLDQSEKESQRNEEIISNCIKYHNYMYFENGLIICHGFFYLNLYHYDKLFELLLKKKEKLIENKIKQYPDIRKVCEENDYEVIYYYLLQKQAIPAFIFNYEKIKQIAIPSSITSIGKSAFLNCSLLTQISIPSSITSIRRSTFSGCSSLTQIIIPSSVTSIGESAFEGCLSLALISIPSSVTSIRRSTFYGCSSLTQIMIPSSVISIEKYAFYGCSSLTQITIPSSVTSVGESAFSRCSSLDKFTIIPCQKKQIEYYNNQFLLSKSNPNSGIYDTLLWVKSTLNTVTIPTFITKIENGSFFNCSSLTQISIPNSVTSIEKFAFFGCSSLTQITIPSSVTSIGYSAFYQCSSLTQITIPSSVASIGKNIFRYLSLPSNVKIIRF